MNRILKKKVWIVQKELVASLGEQIKEHKKIRDNFASTGHISRACDAQKMINSFKKRRSSALAFLRRLSDSY